MRPAWRMWLLLLGGLVLFVAAQEMLEKLFPHERPVPSEAAEAATVPEESVRPKITRLDDGVEIEIGFRRTTIRLGQDEGSIDDLIACINERIDRAIAEGRWPESTSADFFARLAREGELANEVNRIVTIPCFEASTGRKLSLSPDDP